MNPNMKLQYQVLAALGLDGDDEILEDVSDDEFDEEVPEFAYPITILFAQRDGKVSHPLFFPIVEISVHRI